ncbi:MAG: DUF4846 domain-containing protein [Pseudomonadota bacterium]
MTSRTLSILLCAALSAACARDGRAQPGDAPAPTGTRTVAGIPPPEGFLKTDPVEGSFAAFLRALPLKDDNVLRLYTGQPKPNQTHHHAIVIMDVGTRDLQQCADAVIRLRAEWLWSRKKFKEIAFDFTSGDRLAWTDYARGIRPVVAGNKVTWKKNGTPASSYETFRRYLDVIFMYASTRSLDKELTPVEGPEEIRAGDVFVQVKKPYGHAVIVLDTARDPESGEVVFLLAQSYMPAQEIHVLRNPVDPEKSPWFSAWFGATLVTPEWTFDAKNLKRF